MLGRLVVLTILTSLLCCSQDGAPNPEPGPEERYSIKNVLDIGNNNNASDIRAQIQLKAGTSMTNIASVKLVIVKGSKTLTASQVKNLKPTASFSLPLSAAQDQVVKPTESLTDSDGEAIKDGSYQAYIVVLQNDNSTLITLPKEFTLANTPVFAGDYVGTWEDLGPPGPAQFPMSLRISTDYTGKMFYANANFASFGSGAQDATTVMTVNGLTISSFVLNQSIQGYKGGCVATKTLSGKFEDDVNLILNTFNWADCDGTRDVKLKFTRTK